MTSKAAKVDIAAIEYLPADLDPEDDESPEVAKKRYLEAIEAQEPAPTAIIDSGNGMMGGTSAGMMNGGHMHYALGMHVAFTVQ